VAATIGDSQPFNRFEEFETFLKVDGRKIVQQFANVVTQAGHRSCASIARAGDDLVMQFGSYIRKMVDFCRLRSGMFSKLQVNLTNGVDDV